MKDIVSKPLLPALAFLLLFAACSKTGSNSGDGGETQKKDYSFAEEFDTVANAKARGWVVLNNTKPLGTMGWMQGFFYVSMYHGSEPGKFGGPKNYPYTGGFGSDNPSFSGRDFIMTTAECGSGVATLSNWLISPETLIKDGDKITFYTRTFVNPTTGADRLEVRVNAVDNSTDIGTEANSVGGFTNVLLQVNPLLKLEGENSYPGEWTKYTVTVSGMAVPKKSRVAFRYYVPDGGPLGSNGLGVGIDKFEYISID